MLTSNEAICAEHLVHGQMCASTYLTAVSLPGVLNHNGHCLDSSFLLVEEQHFSDLLRTPFHSLRLL